MQRQQESSSGVEIAGTRYLPATDVARHVGVSRTTLWRWRHDGKIPLGRRYRNGLILFAPAEVEVVREYAERLVPATARRMEGPKQRRVSPGRRVWIGKRSSYWTWALTRQRRLR